MIKSARLKKFARDLSPQRSRGTSIYYLSKKTVTEQEVDLFIEYCMDWCAQTFGINEKRGSPDVEWTWNDRWFQSRNFLGTYDWEDNIIFLRIQGHRTVYNLAQSIIHEWIHSLQSSSWYERYYNKLGYWGNPYEIEAHFLGEQYAPDCVKAVVPLVEGAKRRATNRKGSRGARGKKGVYHP